MGHQKQDETVAAATADLLNGQYRDSDTTSTLASCEEKQTTDIGEKDEEIMEPTIRNDYSDKKGCDPLEILPEEIWEIIFGKLKYSPKALINCCKVSVSWEDLLCPKKSTWLFPEIFPFLFAYLKNGDILKCRKVCKSWRNSVDGFIEDYPCHHPSAPDDFDDGDIRRDSVYYPLIKKQLHQIRFQHMEELTKFRLEMEHTSRNPVIGRSICFYSRANEEWMMNALHFLSEFGRHIWYFSFETFHAPTPCIQWLRQCLALLPNLKKLRVYSTLNQHMFDVNANPEYINELMEELKANPLPPVPSLETLEIFAKSLPNPIQDTIISTYAGQLKRLETDAWDEVYANEESFPMINLKELVLKVDSNGVLETLAHMHCPLLKKLTLFLRYRDIDLEGLSRVLCHFKENLQVLKITLSTTACFKMEKFLESFAELVLPKLRVLVLVNAEDLPHNFLRGMKSIEYLHFEKWRRCESVSTDPLSIVQMKGYIPFSDVQGVKVWIWDVLPLLKRLVYSEMGKNKEISSRKMHEFTRKNATLLHLT